MDKKKRNLLVIVILIIILAGAGSAGTVTIISSPDRSTYQKRLISISTEMII